MAEPRRASGPFNVTNMVVQDRVVAKDKNISVGQFCSLWVEEYMEQAKHQVIGGGGFGGY